MDRLRAGPQDPRLRVGVYDDDGAGELTLRTRVPVLVPADAGAVVLPAAAVRPATVRAGELCLATGALTGSLRRLLADQLENLRRSVAVRSVV